MPFFLNSRLASADPCIGWGCGSIQRFSMSTLTIVTAPVGPTPQAAPGKFVDAPASVRPGDVPRAAVVVQLSEQVRQPTDAEKQDNDQRKHRHEGKNLTEEQKREVQELQKTDRAVRSHEAAHKAAAGSYARGGAQFTTVAGPDGRQYAVGGEVSIDTSPVAGDPEATIQKMDQVARAALAPADPSAQDRAVAAQARQASAQARRDAALDGEENPLERSDAATASRGDVASPHGHGASETCPLCQAGGAPLARVHGNVDFSA